MGEGGDSEVFAKNLFEFALSLDCSFELLIGFSSFVFL